MWSQYLKARETERLLLRPLVLEDQGAWEEYINDKEATKYFPEEWLNSKEWIEFQIQRYEGDRYGLLAVVENNTGELIGQCGLLSQKVDGVDELEIGYHLIPRFWGNGFAIEAARALKKLAFENNLADSIIPIIETKDLPSIKVAERNGMTREKQTRYMDMDVFVYRIHKEEYFKN